jgi:hypothetical protein
MAWWDIPTPQTAPYFPPAGGPYPIPPQQPPAFATDPLENAHGTGPQGNVAGSLAAIGGNLGQSVADWYQRQPSWLEQMGAMQQRADQYPLGVLDPAVRSQAGGLLGGFGGGAIGSIKAYHGSPHDFNAFDLSKIGTGEGAQAYGHGLYFAEQEGTAKSYRDALARGNDPRDFVSEIINSVRGKIPTGDISKDTLGLELRKYDPTKEIAGNDELMSHIQNAANNYDIKSGTYTPAGMRSLQALDRTLPKPAGGKMYEVNINADPEHFLDWDKPLSEQHPKVQEAIAKAHGAGEYAPLERDLPKYLPLTGQEAIQGLSGKILAETARGGMPPAGMNASAQAADVLRQAGIPGIKYLDQGSRGAVVPKSQQHMYKPWGGQLDVPKPTSNFVVFDDKLIDIARKYGMAGLMLGSGVAGMPLQSPPYLSQSQ